MALTDFLCLITENIIAIPVIDANIPQRQIQFILFCFYVITKERLDIEFIALNCSINQKTHNNMSVNVFPLSHQAGTIWRHAYSSHTCFSAKGASNIVTQFYISIYHLYLKQKAYFFIFDITNDRMCSKIQNNRVWDYRSRINHE